MNKKKNWGIIGLGWLGQALSETLNSHGVKSWGTHRDQFDWKTDEFPQTAFDILFLNTPPLLTMLPQAFVDKIPSNSDQRILFVSSISVYGNQEGDIKESTLPTPHTERGRWLYAVEQLLVQKFKERVTIIRPGGLIGGHRHPVFQLSQSHLPVAANSPINLVHRQDLIQIICVVAELAQPPQIINAVTPFHPSKENYYSTWTSKLGLAEIKFTGANEPHKIVGSEYLPKVYPHWIHPLLDTIDS